MTLIVVIAIFLTPRWFHRRTSCTSALCRLLVKEDCVSDGEDDVSTDALVEEMLQQGDTAVIYPEAPEEELQRQGTPDASIHDENGTQSTWLQST